MGVNMKDLRADLAGTYSRPVSPERYEKWLATARDFCGPKCLAASWGVCDCGRAYGIFHDARAVDILVNK